MRIRLALLSLLVMLWPATASSQAWRAAYDARDYARAASLLHPIAFEAVEEFSPATGAADAFEALADLYATGLGVTADAVIACTLLDHAVRAARTPDPSAIHDLPSVRRHEAEVQRREKRRTAQCATLGEAERAESASLLPCLTAPFPTHTFDLGPTHSIEISRAGARIRLGTDDRALVLPLFGCTAGFALLRYSRVEPPPGATGLAARHVVEIFTWSLLDHQGVPVLGLIWYPFEVDGLDLKVRAMEILAFSPRAWPLAPPAPALTQVTLSMDVAGDVRWRFVESGRPAGVFDRDR